MLTLFKKTIVFVLALQARVVVRKYTPRIVAVTGSVGKTSAKDAIYAMVGAGAHARKSEKSFNSELGVPLTILGAPNGWYNPLRWLATVLDGFFLILFSARYPEWLVLEVGADRPGDIRSLCRWLPVDIAVITHLPEVPVHVEFFDSPAAVVKEKTAVIDAFQNLPAGRRGTLVLYGDDERTQELAARASARDASVITYGFSPSANVRAEDFKILYEEGERRQPLGMSARVVAGGASAPIEVVGTVGVHALYPLLAAAAVGVALGKNITDIVSALRAYEPPAGRMRLVQGIKNSLIIDDTYNSSPAAAAAGLDTLALIASKSDLLGKSDLLKSRRIAVLGDMLELGRHSAEEHRKAGAHAAKAADMLVTVGLRARGMAQSALDAGMPDAAILQYEDARACGAELKNIVAAGDYVLVKGSQSMRMERVVEELMQEPERASELLVRQDAKWKKK